ncbi:MAG: hypothetical protein BM564_02150 [Bacteroidetes bacterium MedPE-SWsnd-G2]|nr:MAG: hypothetical protein BM564_02150 [Bacteroidetes bacterium MedPE-SWsnd-G2]
MTNTIKPIVLFAVVLALLLAAVFAIHIAVLSHNNLPLYDNEIVKAYGVNYVLALIIFSVLVVLKKKYVHLLGFIYMGGSLVKFAIYFIFFNPIYKADGVIESSESTAFLIPYLSCLFIETYVLIRMLNKEV